jgi:hypothetical protein
MRPSTYNLTLGEELPRGVMLALLVATLVLEAADLWRDWRHAEVQHEAISPDDCWALCAWSEAEVRAWEPLRCECGAGGEE